MCKDCPNKRKFGIYSALTSVLSGYADKAVTDYRIKICQGCPLLNNIDDKMYCGLPRLKHVYRDESLYGCGCNIDTKAKFRSAQCPRGNWTQ